MSDKPLVLISAKTANGTVYRRSADGGFHKIMPVKSASAYAGAMVNRLTEDWPIQILSADGATRWALRQLRARSRDLERNGGIHSAYLSLVEADVIGSKGIGVQMKIREAMPGDDDDSRFLKSKPVTGRVIERQEEQRFLKSLDHDARSMLALPGDKRQAWLRGDTDAVWKSTVIKAARVLKSGTLYDTRDDGLMTVPAGELDRFACWKVESEWKEFCKRGNCDVTAKHSMFDLSRLTLRTSARDGDALLLVYRGFRNKWGTAFQLIEGDYLDDYYNVSRLPNGNSIRMGVELDPWRRKVAFWVLANHPGDYGVDGMTVYDGRRVRIPALGCEPDQPVHIIHITKSKRAEETRAVPWITPAMTLIHSIEAYKEAEITAARAEACKHVMYERDMFTSDGTPLDWEDVNGQLTDELQPGGATELPPGVRANYLDPKHPNANMPDFLKSMKREVAMALNKCYAILFGDLAEANYSNLRGGLQNQRECDKMDQTWFIDDMFRPVFETWLETSLLTGALPFSPLEYDRLNAPEFKPRRWPWVDPQKDAETAVLLIENKLRTRAGIIADMSSEDFEETIDELEYEAGYIASKPNLAAADEKKASLENPAQPAQPENKKEQTDAGADASTKALPLKSAFLGEVAIGELPGHVADTIGEFLPGCDAQSKVLRYQMTVPELLEKADSHNLKTAQRRMKSRSGKSAAAEVLERKDKHILLLNDRIIDGHHHLAKAEKGRITSSLSVLDLTPLKYQVEPASN